MTSNYLDEQQHLEATGRLIALIYASHIKEQATLFSVTLLFFVSTREVSDKECERATTTINKYVSKEWLPLSAVQVTVKHLKHKLTRCYDAAYVVEGGNKPTKPWLSGTVSKLTEQPQRAGGTFPLIYLYVGASGASSSAR